VIPTAALADRNRLADLVLAALADGAARRELEAVASSPDEPDLVRRRARCAIEAIATLPLLDTAPGLAAILDAAGTLFDAGLFFEVHELLEPHWQRAEGRPREALQGLIQVAVGFQHAVNGNQAGARALLAEGAARLHGACLAGRPMDSFAREACIAAVVPSEVDASLAPRFPARA